MIRYSIFVLAVLGSAATAIAAISPGDVIPTSGKNVTIIEKNQAWPLVGPLVVEACEVETCSDTPQG
jgi:hypothetical protein